MKVVMVNTGVANVASMAAALNRAGATVTMAKAGDDLLQPERVVLPGVGSFGAGMSALRDNQWQQSLTGRLLEGRPTLSVCLGLQLLASGSEESAGVMGLGVFPQRVKRFPGPALVPQLGWNRVSGDDAESMGYAYFANSFRLTEAPEGWTTWWSDYDGRFVAALRRGGVLACQFHPELSGDWGAGWIQSWLEAPSC